MRVHVPIGTGRGLNDRKHWYARSRQVKDERFAVGLMLNACKDPLPEGPCYRVTLTRCAPSRGLDSDNLQGSLKAVRDEVAAFLGVDDGSPLIAWEYAQRRADWGVDIGIEDAETYDNRKA